MNVEIYERIYVYIIYIYTCILHIYMHPYMYLFKYIPQGSRIDFMKVIRQ
jgi:hypothetical protein